MNTSGFTERCLEQKKQFELFEDTAFVAVSDGKLEVHELEALLGCLHIIQTGIGKLYYRLQQAMILEASRHGHAILLADIGHQTTKSAVAQGLPSTTETSTSTTTQLETT